MFHVLSAPVLLSFCCTLLAFVPESASPAAATGTPGSGREYRVAVTIDDLPWQGRNVVDRLEGTRSILAALRKAGVTATGFVNCARLRNDEPVVRLWLDAGMDLGNHSDSHRDLNDADLTTWLDDVTRCHETLKRELGRAPAYFRYPYLHQGPTSERREAAAARIASLGYAVAHVSIDNAEWRLAAWYAGAAGAKDTARMQEIAASYVEHVISATGRYREEARRKLGREAAHVLLIHANDLNAGHLGALLDAMKKDGAVFIPLKEALADPLYAMRDEYVGPWGTSFIDRVPPLMGTQDWLDGQDGDLRRRFER